MKTSCIAIDFEKIGYQSKLSDTDFAMPVDFVSVNNFSTNFLKKTTQLLFYLLQIFLRIRICSITVFLKKGRTDK